jgi:hypothetical protein
MNFRSKSRLAVCGLALFSMFVVVFFFLSRERFFLNRVVRNVDMRLLQFQKLSDKRNESFKFHFSSGSLTISNFHRNREEWNVYLEYTFPGDIVSELENFEVIFHDGELTSLTLGPGEKILQPYVILYFYPKERVSPKKGIIFYVTVGDWRVLRKKI